MLVLAGLATTSTLQSLEAKRSSESPCSLIPRGKGRKIVGNVERKKVSNIFRNIVWLRLERSTKLKQGAKAGEEEQGKGQRKGG